MSPVEFIVAMVAAALIMGALDYVWLGFVAKKIYYDEIGSLLRDKPNMIAAVLFYAIYVIGTVVFAVSPAVEAGSWVTALCLGAFLGFVAYATYDLTNLATIKGFSTKVVIIDLIWGAALTAVVAVGAYTAVGLIT